MPLKVRRARRALLARCSCCYAWPIWPNRLNQAGYVALI